MKNDLEIEPSMGPAGRGLAAGMALYAASEVETLPLEPVTVVLASEISPAGDSPAVSFFQVVLHRNSHSAHNLITVQFTTKFAKTEAGNNLAYTLYEFDVGFFNAPLLLVALGIAQKVFEGEPTLAEVLNPGIINAARSEAVLVVKEECLGLPVATAVLPQSQVPDNASLGEVCVPDVAWGADRYNKLFGLLCQMEGYVHKIRTHDMRAMVIQARLMENGGSFQSLQHAIGHRVGTDTWQKYVRGVTMEDFQTVVLGELSAPQKVARLNQMQLEHVPDRPAAISSKGMADIAADRDMLNLLAQQEDLRFRIKRDYGSLAAAPDDLREQDKKLYKRVNDHYNRLYQRHTYRTEVLQYHKRVTSADVDALRNARQPEVADPVMDAQLDAFLDGEAVEYDATAAIAALASTDFTCPGQLITLMAATTTEAEALDRVASSLKQAPGVPPARSSRASTGSTDTTDNSVSDVSVVLGGGGESSGGQQQQQQSTDDDDDDDDDDDGLGGGAGGTAMAVDNDGSIDKGLRRGRSGAPPTVDAAPSALVAVSAPPSAPAESPFSLVVRLGFDPKADQLAFGESLLALPALGHDSRGFWPAFPPIPTTDGDLSCPVCGVTGQELLDDNDAARRRVSKGKGVKGAKTVKASSAKKASSASASASASTAAPPPKIIASASTELMRGHILTCAAKTHMDDSLEVVSASLKQDSRCPVCPMESGMKNTNAKEDLRSPHRWAEHLERHLGDSCCGMVLDNITDLRTHVLVHHDIYAKKGLSTDKEAPNRTKLLASDFPTPPFSLFDNSFYAHPKEWELHLTQEFEAVFVSRPGSYAPTSKRTKNKQVNDDLDVALKDLELLVPKPTDGATEDDRFMVKTIHAKSAIVSQYGRCILCVYDTTLPMSERLHAFVRDEDLRRHVHKHFWWLWKSHDDALVAGDQPPTHTCPVTDCGHHDADLQLHELWNHFTIHHSAVSPRNSQLDTMVANSFGELEDLLRTVYIKSSGDSTAVRVGLVTNPDDVGKNHKKFLDRSKRVRTASGKTTNETSSYARLQSKKQKGKGKGRAADADKEEEDDEELEVEVGEGCREGGNAGPSSTGNKRKAVQASSDSEFESEPVRRSARAKQPRLFLQSSDDDDDDQMSSGKGKGKGRAAA